MNAMQHVRVGKVTLNIGAGKDQTRLDKGVLLIKRITGREPVKVATNKRIPAWGLRPGLFIGCKLTIRKADAVRMLTTLLDAKDKQLKETQFDDYGNVSFGIPEYIDIPGLEYDPNLGVLGLQVCVTLQKPGSRVLQRKIQARRIPKKQRVSRQEAIEFMRKTFNVQVGESQ